MSDSQLIPQDDGFKLEGELSFATVPRLMSASKGFFKSGEVEVDLAGVHRADSAGVALLVHWEREAQRHGGSICFHNAPEQMLAIAKVSGVDDLLSLD
jgi:phospholipid transport system transporter-binding protein